MEINKFLTKARKEMRLPAKEKKKFLEFTSEQYFNYVAEHSEYYGDKINGYECYGYDFSGEVTKIA